MSVKIMTRVWDCADEWLRGSRRLVLLALADNANDEGYCWPSQSTIAKKANLGKRYVIDILAELEQRGYIEAEHRFDNGKKTSNMYRVIVNPASLGSEPHLTRIVNPASHKPSFNRQLIKDDEEDTRRPNIFALYEQNFGALTPMMAETLRDAEGEYSEEWVTEAFKIAVANNARKWSYVQAILTDWKKDGYKNDKRRRSNGKTGERDLLAGIREFMAEEVDDGNTA